LRRLYRLVKPRYSVPVHGEWRHLSAHAALAQEAGITPLLLEDGDILSLAPGVPEVVDSAPVGRLVLDGNRLVPLQGGVMGARRRMLFNGVAVASLAVDEAGRLRGVPRVTAPGLLEPDDPEMARIAAEFTESVADLPAPLRRDDAALADAAKTALRRALGKRLQKRPLVDVHVLRV
jgi:ribonuclease J